MSRIGSLGREGASSDRCEDEEAREDRIQEVADVIIVFGPCCFFDIINVIINIEA